MNVGSVGASSYFAQGAGMARPASKREERPAPAEDSQRASHLAEAQQKVREAVAEQLQEKLKKGRLTPEEEEELRKTVAREAARQMRGMLDMAASQSAGPVMFDLTV